MLCQMRVGVLWVCWPRNRQVEEESGIRIVIVSGPLPVDIGDWACRALGFSRARRPSPDAKPPWDRSFVAATMEGNATIPTASGGHVPPPNLAADQLLVPAYFSAFPQRDSNTGLLRGEERRGAEIQVSIERPGFESRAGNAGWTRPRCERSCEAADRSLCSQRPSSRVKPRLFSSERQTSPAR